MRITSRFHRYRVALVSILLVLLAASSSVLNGTPIAAAASCEVTYTVIWANEQSFTADVKIRNNGAAVNAWTLAWTFPGNQMVSSAWNTTLTQSGANVSARNANWNASIPSGGMAGFGFNANFSGANDRPTNFTLNGVACDSSSSPTSTPASTPTSGPTNTPTRTPTTTAGPPVVTVSVTPSATNVAVGDTIVVQATSNLGIPRYTLTVIDSSIGAVQDQANPIFTPAQPAPISVSSGGVSWTLQAARTGTVRFAVGVNGEILDPRCNCFIFTNGSATSVPVTVRAGPTPTNTPTRTVTPGPPPVTASVTPSATDVAVGDTIVVQATSNLGLERFTLTVIDLNTGNAQDAANPIFTPAQPAPISVNSGGVSWTLQAVRAGTVRFVMNVNGETFDPGNPSCGCSHTAFGNATSGPVTVRPRPTPTSTPTNSCSTLVTILSQWNGGFQDEVKITNTGTTTTNGWMVTWRFSGNQTISNLSGGIYTQNGPNVTVRNQSWNGRLDPGRSATFGFVATGSASGALTNVTCTLTP